jgi:hypothetical protein
VYANLRVHDARYPSPAELKSKIRVGNIAFDGDISKDSPGSDLIRQLLLDSTPAPIYLLAWGGASTIARALKSIQDQYSTTPQWSAIHARVSHKAILSLSGDQDDTYADYIKPNWPDIRVLPAGHGGVDLAYGARTRARPEDAAFYDTQWTHDNVSSRGPLGAFYRVWGDGRQMVEGDVFDYFGVADVSADSLKKLGYVVWLPPRPKGEFLGEGDTFTYLNLIDNGLRGFDDATPGGWSGFGGAFGASTTPGAPDFTPAAQKALAARLLWSVTPSYRSANHEPRVRVLGEAVRTARPGETIQLAAETSDPDGNAVTVTWWRWKDADTYPGVVTIANATSLAASVQVPADARPGETIQLVLEATDNGTPALTHYARVAITVH